MTIVNTMVMDRQTAPKETTMNDDDRIALARQLEGLSRELIGSFPAACGGRHFHAEFFFNFAE